MTSSTSSTDIWPQLAVDSWQPTRRTLHMWLQMVGKVQLMSSFLVNHWWNASYTVTARGLRTGLMLSPDGRFDADAARTWWRQVLAAERVMSYWRAGFGGMASPVMVFWGSMDLTATRFNGQPAPPHHGGNPPNCPGWVMQEAESQVNAAAGFWPGGSAEGSFYAYLSPAPTGYDTGKVSVGSFDPVLGEWILPYEQVRTSADPQQTLPTFLDETYALGADLGGWDRARLDINPRRLDSELFDGAHGGSAQPPAL